MKSKLKKAIDEYFIYKAVPFSHIECPEFRAIIDIAIEYGSEFKGKGDFRHSNAEGLQVSIQSEYDKLMLQRKAELQKSAQYGITLVADGRDFHKNFSVINHYAISPSGFIRLDMRAKNGEYANAQFYVDDLMKVANQLADNVDSSIFKAFPLAVMPVAHVILDGANVNRKTQRILIEKLDYKIFAQLCSAHGFSKVAEKLCDFELFAPIKSRAHDLIKLINNRDCLRSHFRRLQGENPRKLLGFCATRFSYVIISLQRLLSLKKVIINMMPLLYELAAHDETPDKDLYKYASEIIVTNDFWVGLLDLVYVLEPVLVRVRFFDTSLPGQVCWVREAWIGLIEEVELRWKKSSFKNSNFSPLLTIIQTYQTKYSSEVHNYADLLEPSHWPLDKQRLINFKSFKTFLSAKFNIPSEELVKLHTMLNCAETNDLPAYSFWLDQRDVLPAFAHVAARICAGVASTSECERDFSTLKFIWSNLRSKLKLETVNKMASLYRNRSNSKKEIPILTLSLAKKSLSCTYFQDIDKIRICAMDVEEDEKSCLMVSAILESMEYLDRMETTALPSIDSLD